MIILYLYNDFISPYISNIIKPYLQKFFPQNKNTNNTGDNNTGDNNTGDNNTGDNNTGDNNSNNIEAFSHSSIQGNKSLENTAQFDTNWYLRDPNKAIISSNQISLPVIRYGFYANGSYENLVGQYFRHHIYPIEMEQLVSNLDTIYKFINNDIDIAFINEELLTRYIKKDCKYLTNIILDNLGLNKNVYDLSNQDNIDRLYPPINFSAIGIGFHQDFYLIVNNYSNIIEFLDIKNKSIGILADSYYYFIKLCSAYEISPDDLVANKFMEITVEANLEDLIAKFRNNKYDGIFLVAHPKNKQLLDLSLKMKMRYIHIQKRVGLDARKNLANLVREQQGTNPLEPPPPPSANRQAIYSKKVMDDLQTENIKESFNKIIKKYFQYIMPRTVDLNKFHKSGNMYSYLETFSTRMILVVRDDIPKDRVKYITENYINNLEKMRDLIDREEFQIELNNFSSLEFNYQELLSFDAKIPLAQGAKDVYKKEGLIYYKEDVQSKL